MNRQILDKPFPANLIRTRKGRGNVTLSYVEGADVIRVLNDAFDAKWDFIILDKTVGDEEVIVLGQLEAEGITKQGFGGKERREKSVLSDDLKSAATDSLKKCASMFGVGLHLWMSDPQPSNYVAPVRQPVVQASSAQVAQICELAYQLPGWDSARLTAWTTKHLGAGPPALSPEDADRVIAKLKVMNEEAGSAQ